MRSGSQIDKGAVADKSVRYMPRYQVATVAIAAPGRTLEETGRSLATALLFEESLPLDRVDGRYVVRSTDGGEILAALPLRLTEPLDNEYAARATWAVMRLFPKEKGRVKLLIKRSSPRHGFLSTYQNEGCRCADCTAANAQAAAAYRHKVNPPRDKVPRKHGAQCWKYGCYCEERRAADRARQAKRRARLAAEKAVALAVDGDPDGVEKHASTVTSVSTPSDSPPD